MPFSQICSILNSRPVYCTEIYGSKVFNDYGISDARVIVAVKKQQQQLATMGRTFTGIIYGKNTAYTAK